jgi:hypothetical protein
MHASTVRSFGSNSYCFLTGIGGFRPNNLRLGGDAANSLAIWRGNCYTPNITALPRLLSVTESVALPPQPKGGHMSDTHKFSLREWLVPPVVLPIFFALLIAAAVIIQW